MEQRLLTIKNIKEAYRTTLINWEKKGLLSPLLEKLEKFAMLKCAPQHNIDKNISGAYVAARRALGYKEELPKNYKKILQDKDFTEYAINKLEEEKQKTKDKLQKERNEYKQKPLRRRIKQLGRDIKLLQSLSSEPQTQEPGSQRKEQARYWYYTSYKLWQVAKAALTIPVLGKSPPRDLSPLKPILAEGDGDRVVKGLVPVSWDRDEGNRRNTASGGVPVAVKAEYKYPSPKCES
jgi:hypothetical protein